MFHHQSFLFISGGWVSTHVVGNPPTSIGPWQGGWIPNHLQSIPNGVLPKERNPLCDPYLFSNQVSHSGKKGVGVECKLSLSLSDPHNLFSNQVCHSGKRGVWVECGLSLSHIIFKWGLNCNLSTGPTTQSRCRLPHILPWMPRKEQDCGFRTENVTWADTRYQAAHPR